MAMINFLSLEPGANFYVIGTNNGLSVAVGTIKEKSTPYWPMPAGTMNSQLINLTVTFNEQDRVIQGLPINLEIAGRAPEIYTGNRELANRIIDEKMAEAQNHLQNRPLYEKILADGPACKEVLNPEYAATRKQVETIEQLRTQYDSVAKELEESKKREAEMFKMLQDIHAGLNGNTATPKGKNDKKES